MRYFLLCLPIVLLQLVAWQQAWCRPPDQVIGSPIPPLQKPQPRRATPNEAGWGVDLGLNLRQTSLRQSSLQQPVRANQAKQPARANQAEQPATKTQVERSADAAEYQESLKTLWNSREMQVAVATVKEFCRRAAQTSPDEGEQFLNKLAELSPDEQQDWLERFYSRRRSVALGREVDAFTRQIRVERSLNARLRSAENVAELRRQSTIVVQSSSTPKPFMQIPSLGVEAITSQFGVSYDPLEAVVDPVSPRGYRRKVAAAMSLPGDLPRSDPRNFIRGEEGVDFGEWATSKNAQPPGLAAPPPGAVPAPPGAVPAVP